ncbi:hypothetical protein CR152_07285 [Massilia violaceinigra]|uniref:Uncharacterized protein n=1 Tax=Massilia violaceinigra TaxID=2045208 RepID=A0A2D2DH84_9BURK|nr:hypothetical protein [Massilia violaceinigra]ATQ74334.1 hypothetical protein CR152_07285 [Massilia violaceinigra]
MSAPIGSVNDLVSVIRAQLGARVQGAPLKKTAARKQAGGAGRYAQENLGQLVQLRIAQIGVDDPQRGRKAFRVFLEAVLLSHFGEDLVGDPGFFQMVEKVQDALDADAACRQMIGSAIEHLLSKNT